MFKKKYLLFFVFFIFNFKLIHAEIVITLSKTEEKVLSEFFHSILWGSQVGYVLYGNKPICMEAYGSGDPDEIFKIGHHFRASLNNGINLWKKLRLSLDSPKFVIILQENLIDPFVLFINKEAFKNTFTKHAFLFRYALGVELTADQLLDEFKSNKKDFFSILNDDNILIGILLGFGLENSLYVGRSEQILENFYEEKKICSHNWITCANSRKDKNFIPPLIYSKLQPRLGYQSLEQEKKALDDKIKFSSIALTKYAPQLIFGRTIQEDNELINHYEETQLKLLDILNQPQWLTDVLSHFYGQPVRIKIKTDQTNDNHSITNLNQIIAQALFYDFMDTIEQKSAETRFGFIEGMKEAEKRKDAHYIAPFPSQMEHLFPSKSEAFFLGFISWSFYKFNHEINALPAIITLLENCAEKNIQSFQPSIGLNLVYWQIFDAIDQHEKSLAITHFENLEKRNNVKCLVKDRLYYQQIKIGNGQQINKNSIIQATYVLKTIYGNIIEDHSKGSSIDLQRTIKGLRESFSLMKEGEQGILFIHPDWSIKDYFSSPYFSPYLIAEFEIHKILEKENEAENL